MGNWIIYDDFVDLVRKHHHNDFSGLITGVSDSRHSFQIGFDRGEIVLLTYRIKKGLAALQHITQIERAKITEHPNCDIQEAAAGGSDTSMILSQLTANTLDETTTMVTDISDAPAPRATSRTSSYRTVDPKLKRIIEAAAVHHFGPIGAMVCEQHLVNPQDNARAILSSIAQDVGANESDTRAFFRTVSNS